MNNVGKCVTALAICCTIGTACAFAVQANATQNAAASGKDIPVTEGTAAVLANTAPNVAESGSDSKATTATVQPTEAKIPLIEKVLNEEEAKAFIKQYLAVAFDADLESMTDVSNPPYCYRFLPDPDNEDEYYFVDFREGSPYPENLMHHHKSETQDSSMADIAKADIPFHPDWIPNAQEFVKRVYGVDCSEAPVFAYRYNSKVAVVFKVSEKEFFDVRFYCTETTPSGCVFMPNESLARCIYDYTNATSFDLSDLDVPVDDSFQWKHDENKICNPRSNAVISNAAFESCLES